jgi:hypothetical protein
METVITRSHNHSSYFGGTIPEEDIIIILLFLNLIFKSKTAETATCAGLTLGVTLQL